MSQQTYSVNNQRKLVDLNGDSKNFNLTFTCTSDNNAPFQVIVVDQKTLDSVPNLQYKKAYGTISGNIIADKNVYQNYFLILKADNPCRVTVTIYKKEIPPKLPTTTRRPEQPQPRPLKKPSIIPPSKPKTQKWKYIVFIVAGIIVCFLIYLLFFRKKKKNTVDLNTNSPSSPALSVTHSVAHSVAPSVCSSTGGNSPTPSIRGSPYNPGLYDKLKNLDVY